MKPKERFLNYGLLAPDNCEPNQSPFKEDIPIDLSVKKQVSIPSGHPFGLFKEYEHSPFLGAPHLGDWAARYCFPNMVAKHYGYSPNLLPYLFINPNCLPGPEIEAKKRGEAILDPFLLPYRLPQDGVLFPFKIDPFSSPPYHHPKERQSDRPPASTESSSSSSSSSPYNHQEYHLPEYPDTRNHDVTKSTGQIKPDDGSNHHSNHPNHHHTSQVGSQDISAQKAKLRKFLSYPCLPSLPELKERTAGRKSPTERALVRSKSECNLHLIKWNSTPTKACAPKKLFASNYYQNKMKEDSTKINDNHTKADQMADDMQTKFYRNYRKEVIECWEFEKRGSKGRESGTGSDILDLRMTNTPTSNQTATGPHVSAIDAAKSAHLDKLLQYGDCASKRLVKQPPVMATHPLDLYRQYYYYLIQEPSFASRAAAVAVAETYAKLLSGEVDKPSSHHHTCDKSPPLDASAIYESKRTSPDCSVNSSSSSRTELRSADTTNGNLAFDRKRISRPLTGKHVRHGTGASPSTLVTLRNMIQQRQKLKQSGKFDCSGRYGKAKANKRFKRK